jgi:hypothetical protein
MIFVVKTQQYEIRVSEVEIHNPKKKQTFFKYEKGLPVI